MAFPLQPCGRCNFCNFLFTHLSESLIISELWQVKFELAQNFMSSGNHYTTTLFPALWFFDFLLKYKTQLARLSWEMQNRGVFSVNATKICCLNFFKLDCWKIWENFGTCFLKLLIHFPKSYEKVAFLINDKLF